MPWPNQSANDSDGVEGKPNHGDQGTIDVSLLMTRWHDEAFRSSDRISNLLNGKTPSVDTLLQLYYRDALRGSGDCFGLTR
jgi:hypothetical protein